MSWIRPIARRLPYFLICLPLIAQGQTAVHAPAAAPKSATHAGTVLAVAFSPDGKWIASGGDDKAVKLWDATTGRRVQEMTKHAGAILELAFTYDSTRLLSAGDDGAVNVWELPAGNLGATYSCKPTCYSLATGHSSLVTAIGLGGGFLVFKLVGSERPVQIHLRGAGPVNAIALSPDDKHLAIAWGEFGSVLDAGSGTFKQERLLNMGEILQFSFSPDSRYLVAGNFPSGGFSATYMWDLQGDSKPKALDADGSSVAFSPDGRLLAAGGNAGVVTLWDTATWKRVRSLEGHTSEVRDLAFSPDGKRLVSGSADRTVRLWEVDTGKQISVLSD